jgi:FGGY-family pentulose kinase/HAD superfamily hydrolase (TIGR01509 family)
LVNRLMSDPTQMAPIKLVIFDCDGVLVDSEPLAMRVLLELIAEQGIDIERDVAFGSYLGRSLASISESLNDSHGAHLSDASVAGMRDRLYALYRQELQPTGWIAEVVAGLGLPFCVASSSQVERIRLSLELTGLLPAFEGRIYSASMVRKGKPAPDLFLHAAEAMGVAPENCLVIEDSPAGIRAARAAGMRVFAYVGGGHAAEAGLRAEVEQLSPDAILDDMRALPGLLELQAAREAGRPQVLVAVDVGTASARAGIATPSGRLIGRAEHPLELRRSADSAEYDSEQIWDAVAHAVRAAMRRGGVQPEEAVGISFDATCSLVVRDRDGAPLPVSPGGADRWDTMAWFDHRALAEAEECTATGHRVLDFVGGTMSPEMEVPKIMWLKRHVPETWERAGHLFDLADFLTWKASGSTARSECTLTCKWTYLAHETPGWQRDFLALVGLDDLLAHAAMPDAASPIGLSLGPLTELAAADLGLSQRCVVGVGLIDAHAGALGSLASFAGDAANLHRHLALIAGTSSCVMALSGEPRPTPGVWGPYYGAVLPRAWLNEAGQSATGALLDHILRSHAAGGEPIPALHHRVVARVRELRQADPDLGARLHVLPDFHGNRSPLADPRALGVIAGLTLDSDFDSLCRLYWRAAVSIAVQVRHILETLNARGYSIDTLHITGGHTHNALLMELYADATGCTVIEPNSQDATLLGVAIVAAAAAGLFPDLPSAASAMAQASTVRLPSEPARRRLDRDYRVQLAMHRHREEIEALM